ncbi:MAG: helix-turn-helix domain-containing protein [Planctomycetes bacterium]|nr:helix-turn-helix domain-containing protein [Planctomycetota bacterium]
MRKKSHKTSDAVDVLHRRYIQGSRTRAESLKIERENLSIAEQIHTLRTQAGLSQKQLAAKVGTTQSVISRLEDADYDGHSLVMLRRIASALHQKVEVRFLPEDARYTRV